MAGEDFGVRDWNGAPIVLQMEPNTQERAARRTSVSASARAVTCLSRTPEPRAEAASMSGRSASAMAGGFVATSLEMSASSPFMPSLSQNSHGDRQRVADSRRLFLAPPVLPLPLNRSSNASTANDHIGNRCRRANNAALCGASASTAFLLFHTLIFAVIRGACIHA